MKNPEALGEQLDKIKQKYFSNIKTLPFSKEKLSDIKNYEFGKNWPVVYILENGKEAYVGQTDNAFRRSKEHYDNPVRRSLSTIHLISDEEYNKSATLDIESSLIQYIFAEGRFVMQNGNQGLLNHNYYDRQRYLAKFEIIWQNLQEKSIVKKDLIQIKNSDLFKYSPYKALTADQLEVAETLIHKIKTKQKACYLINGKPGTGKTILAVYILKYLKDHKDTKELKIALVVPMTALRNTIKKVFKNVKGLSASMVIGPSEVANGNYDLLIVDEAHRLRQRKNITNYQSFDVVNKKLALGKDGTELDWIMHSSNQQIFFYDQNQSVRPSDVDHERFVDLKSIKLELSTQLRVGEGRDGEEYIEMIEQLFDLKKPTKTGFENYDFKIYNDLGKMVSDIKRKNSELELCRMISGYAWPWISKRDPDKHDIEIGGIKLFWNSTNHNWVNSDNAINEVGCIHTIQGYDLNYAGVIIGPELSYDKQRNRFVINVDKYMDVNGRRGVDDPEELERYILNIYKTLLTRGIKGTYVFVVDKNLREYLEIFKAEVQ